MTTADVVSEHLRLFVAISLPEQVKDAVEKAQLDLRSELPPHVIRWTKRNQFHLTLRFLGDVNASDADAVKHSLRAACDGFGPLQLRAERMGFFPHLRSPRVVWVWVHDAAEILPQLQQSIQRATAPFTREVPEEKFTGHVTLGRVKQIRRAEADALGKLALGMAQRQFGDWTADKVELIRSELSPEGSRYTTIGSVFLG